ncbi:probable UDP-3-O-acylglucosamine N-acyltransferase 2, mitochondrial isoform X2 [Aristolochia californica]|uniref:probable UDP-3-O-acylglucosamine N-acyltransferase 2, mitochondrial isoform X2 n=1 Tax=Aristolochia californica TaxID=171875 RepID=UPI0035DF578A
MAVVLRKFAAAGQSTKAFGFLLFKLGSDDGYASWRSQRLMSESPKVLGSRAEAAHADSSRFARWHNGGGIYHKSANVDPTAIIDIGAVVNEKAVLGANVHLLSGAIIGPSCFIGQSTNIGYNAVLNNCSIGDSSIIHSGVCIGQDGFGFFVDDEGNLIKKPQTLLARIGNFVEIGANTCIDRGSWRNTVIGDHCKIDNLVQIGHNVVIGKGCMLCGQVGIAGSATLGDYVVLGGRVAVRDHVSIASKVRLAGNSCVTKDITDSGDYGGFPAVPIKQWLKQLAILRRTSKDVS